MQSRVHGRGRLLPLAALLLALAASGCAGGPECVDLRVAEEFMRDDPEYVTPRRNVDASADEAGPAGEAKRDAYLYFTWARKCEEKSDPDGQWYRLQNVEEQLAIWIRESPSPEYCHRAYLIQALLSLYRADPFSFSEDQLAYVANCLRNYEASSPRPDPRRHFVMGSAHRRARNFTSAQECLNQAIDSGYASASTYRELSQLWCDQGDREKAEVAFEKALAMDPEIPEPAWDSADRYRRRQENLERQAEIRSIQARYDEEYARKRRAEEERNREARQGQAPSTAQDGDREACPKCYGSGTQKKLETVRVDVLGLQGEHRGYEYRSEYVSYPCGYCGGKGTR